MLNKIYFSFINKEVETYKEKINTYATLLRDTNFQ